MVNEKYVSGMAGSVSGLGHQDDISNVSDQMKADHLKEQHRYPLMIIA